MENLHLLNLTHHIGQYIDGYIPEVVDVGCDALACPFVRVIHADAIGCELKEISPVNV